MMYNWIMRRKLNPREDANGGIRNFTGRIKGMHVFIGNFTYVIDFMIVEDISSILDPRLSQVVLGRPFIEISNMTHDPPEGVVRFIRGTDEVSYKMPHKIEQYDSLSDLEKKHTKSVYLRNEEDKRRGVEYVMSKILGFYKECLELGPEYLTGVDDKGEVTLYLMRRNLEVLRKFHWMILVGRSNQLSHVSSPLLSKPGEYYGGGLILYQAYGNLYAMTESIERFLNRFADQPNETNINDPESDDGSVETPLVSPFPYSDNESDDEEVLNELSEYENARTLRRERIINSLDGDDLAFECMIGFRKFSAYLDPFLPMNIISRKAYNTIMVDGLEGMGKNLVAIIRDV
ncbi:hypothetical protein Tco_0180178 [Tanacetum coccineum]